mgnify:FL=1
MKYKPLGQSGFDASIIGLGGTSFGGYQEAGAPDDKQSINAIHSALDHGITLIDTAPSYGWGHSERIVGKAIKGRRDKVVIATKCGVWWKDKRGSPNGVKDGKEVTVSLRPDTIQIEVEDSLKRLNTDYIDLLQCHKPSMPPEETPIEDTMECLMDLKLQGKIRAIGVSNVSLEQLTAYNEAGDLASDQFRYSMLTRDRELDILPYCENNNIATLTYLSLEQGLLTGKVTPNRVFDKSDFRRDIGQWAPWFKKENTERLLEMFSGWEDLFVKYKCTIAQLTMAWTAAQLGASHILCGCRTAEQSVQNAGAGSIQLNHEDIQRICHDLVELGDPI